MKKALLHELSEDELSNKLARCKKRFLVSSLCSVPFLVVASYRLLYDEEGVQLISYICLWLIMAVVEGYRFISIRKEQHRCSS